MTNAQTKNRKTSIAITPVRGFETISRVLFGTTPTELVRTTAEMLRKRGYTVEFVAGSEAARRGAVGRTDTAVVVPVQPDASLLLTAKIVTALPTAKVILLAPAEDERVEQFAEFVDANIAFETDGAEELLAAVIA